MTEMRVVTDVAGELLMYRRMLKEGAPKSQIIEYINGWVASLAASPAPTVGEPEGVDEALEQLDMMVKFLTGSEAYEGVWFGETSPTLSGKLWWRSAILRPVAEIIRKALAAPTAGKPILGPHADHPVIKFICEYANGKRSDEEAVARLTLDAPVPRDPREKFAQVRGWEVRCLLGHTRLCETREDYSLCRVCQVPSVVTWHPLSYEEERRAAVAEVKRITAICDVQAATAIHLRATEKISADEIDALLKLLSEDGVVLTIDDDEMVRLRDALTAYLDRVERDEKGTGADDE